MRSFSKAVYRSVRFNPVVERLQNSLRRQSGVYFEEIQLFVPAAPGDVIIDAGANVGVITSKCARTGATVHSFEPNPTCYKILTRRFALQPNVNIHNLGIMDRNCTLTLSTPVAHNDYDDVDTTLAASFVAEKYDAEVTTTEVGCIDIADFIGSIGQQIALLKMDIEGAEVVALHRLLDTGMMDRIKFAVVETHDRFSEEQARETEALRERIRASGLAHKIRLDWI